MDIKVSTLKVSQNPENEFTRIEFSLSTPENLDIVLMNATGRQIEKIHGNFSEYKVYVREIDTRLYPPGVYFVNVLTETAKFVKY